MAHLIRFFYLFMSIMTKYKSQPIKKFFNPSSEEFYFPIQKLV